MIKFIKKILEILDGTPAEYAPSARKGWKGQSVLELALVSPLLIILLAGMAEIGWFAQNYLTLLEVTRVGARTATVQQGETSPDYWEDPANGLLSAMPVRGLSDPTHVAFLGNYRNCNAADSNAKIGFYNYLACIMINSMNPLRVEGFEQGALDPDTNEIYPDEMVISAFSVQAILPEDLKLVGLNTRVDWPLNDKNLLMYDTSQDPNQPQGVVVGRYPSNANECSASGERDPFDYIEDNRLSWANWGSPGRRYDLELTRQNPMTGVTELFGYDTKDENQVGFQWNGQHLNKDTGCFGSEWSVKEVERLINLQGFGLKAIDPNVGPNYQDQRRFVPSQGIVLVELYWQHTTLTQFVGLSPVVSPVLAILGSDTTIRVWAIFPLPQEEPRIDFPHID